MLWPLSFWLSLVMDFQWLFPGRVTFVTLWWGLGTAGLDCAHNYVLLAEHSFGIVTLIEHVQNSPRPRRVLRLQSAARETGFCVWLWEKSVLAAKLLSKQELVCVCWAVLNLFSTASPLCYRADSVDTETRSPWQWWIHPWILMCCIWVELAKVNRENRVLWWHQRVYSAPYSQSQISDGFINEFGLLSCCGWCEMCHGLMPWTEGPGFGPKQTWSQTGSSFQTWVLSGVSSH